ncbi:MAG TPA: helix-turn-helix domain-containing protein [Mycobacteriales bacterium]|nr:helix-turn-helix domain-containing protein [Mycobacteriales bacterium]HVX70927.1 helix-turn-helix domain-containing protein [Mycobacteriales bacterium]
MSASYGQFCPVAKAMELLGERWTLLVVRELLAGSERFNDLRRGVPRMSPSLLSSRLGQLTRAGIVERVEDAGTVRYALTPAGRELGPLVEAYGAWGIRWIGQIGDEDLDPKLLLWDMHRNLNHDAVPRPRAVVQFRFVDVAVRSSQWWLVITPNGADVCDADPGYPVTVTVVAGLRELTRIWRGDLQWGAAIRSGAVELQGASQVRRALPGWFQLSTFAALARPSAGAAR